MAVIQFVLGRDEPVVPDVKLSRAVDGSSGKAMFRFEGAQSLQDMAAGEEIKGMFLLDEEGELATRQVNMKFINGEAVALEALYIMNSPQEWDRFMRFMERYAEKNGLGFSKA